MLNRTLDRNAPFNATYYENLSFVKNKDQVISLDDAVKGTLMSIK